MRNALIRPAAPTAGNTTEESARERRRGHRPQPLQRGHRDPRRRAARTLALRRLPRHPRLGRPLPRTLRPHRPPMPPNPRGDRRVDGTHRAGLARARGHRRARLRRQHALDVRTQRTLVAAVRGPTRPRRADRGHRTGKPAPCGPQAQETPTRTRSRPPCAPGGHTPATTSATTTLPTRRPSPSPAPSGSATPCPSRSNPSTTTA